MSIATSGRVLNARTIAMLTLPPLLWAGNAVAGRMLVGLVPPITLNWLRWVIALAMLLPFVLVAAWRRRRWPAAPWRLMAWIGLLGVGLYNSLQYLALQTSTPVNTTLIAASSPAWILIVGAAFFGATIQLRQWLGAAISITGVLLVLARGEPARLGSIQFVAGDLYMLLATLSWAFYTWLLRRRRPDLSGLDFLALQIVYGVAISAPFVMLESLLGSTTVHWTPTVAVALTYIALGPAILAYVCWDIGVARAGATVPVFFANLTPLFAALLSAALLGERPHAYHVVAFALIFAGIVFALPRSARL